MIDFDVIFARIWAVCQRNKDKITDHDILSALTEELGEYARAVRVEDGCSHKAITEPSYVEAVDILLVTIEAYIARGGKYEDMFEIMDRKLSKWEGSWSKENEIY